MATKSKRKFYRTEIKVVVLSETPYCLKNLAQVHDDITYGDCSGDWSVLPTSKQLTPKQAAAALREQGSDPSFFRLTDDGKDDENVI